MDEITVGDLLAWEPRLHLVTPATNRSLERMVSWVVAARTLPPVLPALRGGEVILLPETVIEEQGVALPALLDDLARQRVAAVVLDQSSVAPDLRTGGGPLPVLSLNGLHAGVEVESDLNRLVTEHRGEIYRRGTDLGRILSALTATGAGLKQVLDVTHEEIAWPIFVTDRTGIILAAAGLDASGPDSSRFDASQADPDLVEHPLRGGGRVWLGPVMPEHRAVARIAADRLSLAVEAALSGANWYRSRGPERAETLTNFILTASRLEPSDARVQAVAIGLDPGATFRVALAPARSALQAVSRAYAPAGTLYEVADIAGHCAMLIEFKPGRVRISQADGRRSSGDQPALAPAGSGAWVAQSGAVNGIAELTEAARQAAYVAGLIGAGLIERSSVRFDSATELGGFSLLYRFWGSAELSDFAQAILGDLLIHDKSGVLRQTLLHFLESGGSRVEAAERAAIHRNTLAYRLRRIAELTQLNPHQPGDRLSLHLAILAQSIPAAPTDIPPPR